MKLRRAQVADAAKLAQVHVDAWQVAYRGLIPESYLQTVTYQKREAAFTERLAGNVEETYLAEDEGRAVAFLTIGAGRDGDVDATRTGEIWGIYVAPDYWRRGLGTRLVQEAERLLRSRGSEEVVLWVLGENLAARHFYEAVGYRLDGAVKTLDRGRPLQVVRYRKRFPPEVNGGFEQHPPRAAGG